MRYTFVAVLDDIQTSFYDQGRKTRISFVAEDSTGSIRGMIWDDAINTFKEVENGKAYKFHNTQVKTSTHSGNLELKIYPDTRIHECIESDAPPLKPVKIGDFENGNREVGELICKIITIGPLESTRKNEPMRRAVVMDDTGQSNLFILGEAAKNEDLKPDMFIRFKGRVSGSYSGKNAFFSSKVVEVKESDIPSALTVRTQDDEDEEVEETGESAQKKQRQGDCCTSLLDAKSLKSGSVRFFKVVVKSRAIGSLMMECNQKTLMATVVDRSMTSMDMSFLVNAERPIEEEIHVGDVVVCEASVFPELGKLVASSIQIEKDEYDLKTWWKSNASANFLDLTLDSAQ